MLFSLYHIYCVILRGYVAHSIKKVKLIPVNLSKQMNPVKDVVFSLYCSITYNVLYLEVL